MTQPGPVITGSYPEDTATNREILVDLLAEVRSIRTDLDRLLAAWTVGGLRGLRQAARSNGG